MALAKRSNGGMSGWLAAALLLLAIYASIVKEPADDTTADGAPVTVDAAAGADGPRDP